jgi:hypothetical protein
MATKIPNQYHDRHKAALISETFTHTKKILKYLKPYFFYLPDINMIVNGLITTGNFQPNLIAEKVSNTFLEGSPNNSPDAAFFIRLTHEAYSLAKGCQQSLKFHFHYRVDLYKTVNAMILTGKYDIAALQKHFQTAFTPPQFF